MEEKDQRQIENDAFGLEKKERYSKLEVETRITIGFLLHDEWRHWTYAPAQKGR